jgi:hypothetical protein
MRALAFVWLLMVQWTLGQGVTFTQKDDGSYDFQAPLDGLMKVPEVWELSPEKLEAAWAVGNFKNNPCIEWLDAGKTRARFSRKPFSNIAVNLTLFGGQVKVEEATVDFVDGAPARLYFSLYNRGDSGIMQRETFDALWKQVGLALKPWFPKNPTPLVPTTASAVKVAGFRWENAGTVALLEFNHMPRTGKAQAEFLRLRVASPKAPDWTMGNKAIGQSSATVSRASLVKNVTKKDGDVFVANVPMVDQGQKGYCVVASCQRMFEYLHVPCDQHEIAQLAESKAQGGTSTVLMEEALDKIDHKYQTRLKRLLSPSERGRGMDEKKFQSTIKESVDAGVPLLWCLTLGRYPEDPPLRMQTEGGHMRMIIGYNEEKQQVLFSDSWGAGHELKRMSLLDALQASHGLYQLLPKTL